MVHRNLPGIRSEDWMTYESKTNMQQSIQHKIAQDPSSITTILSPDEFEPSQYKYEQIRQICNQLNDLFCAMEGECLATTCTEMKTGEWMYLCAAHAEPQQCSAIDYTLHTLEGASFLLQAELFNRQEPLSVAGEKLCLNIVRRLYRIFAHAWFHHHEIFLEFEQSTSLYARFLELTTVQYDMIKPDMLTIPSVTVVASD